ncbi:MAG TPA: ABC transporter permease [bacterium]|nr:ABC transporter permease [bacterium]
MGAYIVRRLISSAFAAWATASVIFGMTFLSGDPVALFTAGSFGTPEYVARLRHALGYDLPITEQYLRFLRGAIHGDLGNSLRWNQPAFPLVVERLPATLELTVAAMFVAVAVAIPVGVFSAAQPRNVIARASMLLIFLAQGIPLFWLGIMLVLVVSVELRLLPPSGRGGLESLVLPAVTLAMYPLARIARLTRSSLLDVIVEKYVTTARAKGLANKTVLYRHALKNAAIPILTIVGLQLGSLFGGAVITETIFAWPGVGMLSIQAIGDRDVPLVEAIVITVSMLVIVLNFGIDLLYSYLDPRIRYS